MYEYDKYTQGKGLNLSDYKIKGTTQQETYTISQTEKYDFVILDFDKTNDLFSEILNFSIMINDGGYFILRYKLEHPEQFKEVTKKLSDFSIKDFQLINFENNEDIVSFVFIKRKEINALKIEIISRDVDKLIDTLNKIDKSPKFAGRLKGVKIFSEDEYWKDEKFYDRLPKLSTASVFVVPGEWDNHILHGWNKHINGYPGKNLLLISDDFDIDNFSFNKPIGKDYLYTEDVNSLRKLNGIDFRYQTVRWGLYDLAYRLGIYIDTPEFNEHDYYRYNYKKYHNLSDPSKRDITVMEALGDNILCFNLINNLHKDGIKVNIRTVYDFLYDLSPELTVNTRKHQLMDGLGFTVYEHGDCLQCETLDFAYFSMFGYPEYYKKRSKHLPTLKYVKEYREKWGNNVILLAPSASNAEGPANGVQISNKTWPLDRWERVVEHLQEKGYYVIQVGTESDLKVENVDEQFFNKSFEELVNLIKISKFFLAIDTFFQHLCGLMQKKGIVVTPRHNEHAFWPSIEYIEGTNYKEDSDEQINYEHLKWIKDHLNPHRKPCMESITEEQVIEKVDNLIYRFDKYLNEVR